MADAGPGTPVTSANPNTTTNTSLAVALATTTAGQLNVITISGLWLVESALARWGWRDREDEPVKVTDRRLVGLQVQSPIDLRDDAVTITACVSGSPAVPNAPAELPIVLPSSYEWPGPAGWATVHAWVGPGLPLGTAYVLTHVVAGGEDFWDVAASMQVEE